MIESAPRRTQGIWHWVAIGALSAVAAWDHARMPVAPPAEPALAKIEAERKAVQDERKELEGVRESLIQIRESIVTKLLTQHP